MDATPVGDSSREAEFQELVVHYKMESREMLERYLKEFAPQMRADGLEKFRDQFRAERFQLEPISLK